MKQILSSISQYRIKKYVLYLASILSALSLSLCIWQYNSYKNELIKNDEQHAINITKNAAKKIAQFAQEWAATVDTIAHELTAGTLEYKDIESRLKQKPAAMRGLGVAFAPYAYDKSIKLFAPYFLEVNHTSQMIKLESIVDYSDPSYERFAKIIQSGPQWIDPIWDHVHEKLAWEYAAPFYDKDHKPIGVVFGNYAIDYIQAFIATLYPSNYGYGEIYTKKGIFISHPNYEYIGDTKTPVDIARAAKDFELAEIFEKALKGEINFAYEKSNWLSAQRSLITFEPVDGTDWLTQGVFVVSELQSKTTIIHRKFINVIISLMVFLIMALLLWLNLYTHILLKAWITSSAISIAMLIITSFIWYGLAKQPAKEEGDVIRNMFNINSSLTEYTKDDDYTLIPTGIYIHNMSLNLNTINISGYVWQHIPLEKLNTITLGVVFPQAQDLVMEKSYQKTHGKWKIISWKFHGALTQHFNFFDYPLDAKHIHIELWPTDPDEKIILIPDIYGYKVFNATSLPGINRKIKMRDWHLNETYFSFRIETYLTNFGYHSPQSYTFDIDRAATKKPRLYFNIEARRNSIGALALSLMPIVIIFVLLFILLLIAGIIEFQFMFGSVASLFFTSLIAYTSFKTYLSAQNVIFLDYIYFLLQGSILIIAVLGILFHKKFKISVLEHKKMLIPQLLFWPCIMGSILTLSLIFFY